MKTRKLIILAAVLALLAAAVLFKKAVGERVVVRPSEVLNPDLATAFVTRIMLSKGGDDAQKIILNKTGAGEWQVESRYGVRAKTWPIEQLFKKLPQIKGEAVSDSKGVLADYKLTEDQAFRILLEGAEGKKLSELFVSPARTGGTRNFVRIGSSDKAVVTETDVLEALGIYSKDDKLKADTFIDYRMMVMDASHVDRVEFVSEKSGTLTMVKTPQSGDTPEAWRLSATKAPADPSSGGGEGVELDVNKVKELMNGVNNFYGKELLDPAGTDYGLPEKPWVRFRLSQDQKPASWELYIGKHLEDKKTTVVRVQPGGMVYELADRHLEPHRMKDKDSLLPAEGGSASGGKPKT